MSTVQIPDFLLDMSKRLHTQNNRITATPLFCVYEKQEVVVPEEMHYDRICWFNDENLCYADAETADKLEEYREDPDNYYWHDNEIELDGEVWRRFAIEEIDKFVTASLTEAGAQEHIEMNGHNLRRPFICVTSLFRTPEMIMLREWLMGLTESEDGEE